MPHTLIVGRAVHYKRETVSIMGKTIHLLAILLSFLELYESSWMRISPKPTYVGDLVKFVCDFYSASGIERNDLKEFYWLKNGERIYSHYTDHWHQQHLPGYEEKIRNHNMKWDHHEMSMIVDPSDEANFQCRLVTNDGYVLRSDPEFLTLKTSEACETNLTDDVGIFTSPLHPGYYPSNVHCVWNIIAPEQFYINITFVQFTIASYVPCKDYVHIWDGNDDLGIYCTSSPGTVYSISNTMRVIFHTDSWASLRGFRAEYEFLTTADTTVSFMFMGPNPAYVGDQLHLLCSFFHAAEIDVGSVKELHWLKNGERFYSHYHRSYQGPLPGYEEKIGYHRMMRDFHQMIMLVDPSDDKAVFQCMFKTDISAIKHSYEVLLTLNKSEPCLTKLTDHSGNFTTPLYPKSYPRNAHCVWNIIAPEQFYIKLTFVDFEMERSKAACFDYVQIWDGNNDLGMFCRESPNTLYSTNNTMTVIFHSDEWAHFRGFLVEYEFQSQAVTRDLA